MMKNLVLFLALFIGHTVPRQGCTPIASNICNQVIADPEDLPCPPAPEGYHYDIDQACKDACLKAYKDKLKFLKDNLCAVYNTIKTNYTTSITTYYSEYRECIQAGVPKAECQAAYDAKKETACEIYNNAVKAINDVWAAAYSQALKDYRECSADCCILVAD